MKEDSPSEKVAGGTPDLLRRRPLTCVRLFPSLVWIGLVSVSSAQIPNSIHVPLSSDRWQVSGSELHGGKPDIQFLSQEGFPEGLLVLKSGSATLKGLTFHNGTVEFDMKGIGEDIAGIQFRQSGAEGAKNAEEFYVRTSPDCRASNDCIQYTPVINGFLLWNSYPQYQTRAFIFGGWNHFKLVVSGHRMNVYINGLPSPARAVGSLEGSSMVGGLELRGPAFFANLTVTQDAIEGLSPLATPDPTANEQGLVRHWQLGPLSTFHGGVDPTYADLPGAASTWTPVTAGRFGMVNLNRLFNFSTQPHLAAHRSHVGPGSKQASLFGLDRTGMGVRQRASDHARKELL